MLLTDNTGTGSKSQPDMSTEDLIKKVELLSAQVEKLTSKKACLLLTRM